MRRLLRSLLLLVSLLAQASQAVTIHALNFDKNSWDDQTNIRLVWNGSNLLPRAAHTAIFRYNPHPQEGYYAVFWHAPNDGSFSSVPYYFGTHPYPATDCQVNGSGAAQSGSSTSTDHCWESAGPADRLATDGTNPGYTVVKNTWYVQARRVRLGGACGGAEYEHTYFLDLVNNPTRKIQHCQASLGSAGGSPAFYMGSSDWTSSGDFNGETLGGKIRGLQFYSAGLSDADILTEAANQYTNTPQTASGISNVWYMNQDPTVADVTDKSGAGHSPSWATSVRPVDWDSTYSTGSTASGRMLLMGAGR
jgi:hypothetical protein